MKNKSLISVFAIIIIGIIAYFYFTQTNNTHNYVIGCSAPLTGNGANYGRSVREGVELAIKEINREHFLKKPLKVIYEDDKMDPKEGVNAVSKLINTDKVPVIIGPFGSSIVLAAAPVAEKNKTILISASATADEIENAGDYIFRITPKNSKQGSDDAVFSYDKLKARRAAIIYQNNDYGITLKHAFKEKFIEKGGKVSVEIGVDLNTSDLKTQLLKIKDVKPDVVFFPLHYRESGIMLKQAKEIGLDSYFISADGAMTEDMLKIAGNSAEGAYFSTLALGYGLADNKIKKFQKGFKEEYNKEPDIYSAYYYEVTWLIANAIKNAGMSSDAIKDYFYSLKDGNCYFGITGKTCFDDKGEVNKPFYIYVVKNGKYTLTR